MPLRHVTKESGRNCTSIGGSRSFREARWMQIKLSFKDPSKIKGTPRCSLTWKLLFRNIATKRLCQSRQILLCKELRVAIERYTPREEKSKACKRAMSTWRMSEKPRSHSFLPWHQKPIFWLLSKTDRSIQLVRPVYFYQSCNFFIRPVVPF